MLVVARDHTAELLEPVDHTLNHISALIGLSIEARRPSSRRSLGFACLLLVLALGDDMRDLATAQKAADPPVAERPIPQEPLRALADAARGPAHRNVLEHRLDLRALVPLPRREDDRERAPFAVAAYMELGAEAAAAASQGLVRWMKLPLFAACFGASAAC
jgi:hypothetical protein